MNIDEAVKELNAITNGDNEYAHCQADKILKEFLRSNGYAKVADAFDEADDRVGFWYA